MADALLAGDRSAYDLSPVLLAYRKALELGLKTIAWGDGVNFLEPVPDYLGVEKSRSLLWLGNIVIQLVKRLRWESLFQCEGVSNLADFKSVLEQANLIDAEYDKFTYPELSAEQASEFLRLLDRVFELLDNLAAALTAEWAMRSAPAQPQRSGAKPTVH